MHVCVWNTMAVLMFFEKPAHLVVEGLVVVTHQDFVVVLAITMVGPKERRRCATGARTTIT